MDLVRKLIGGAMLLVSALGFIGVVTNPPPSPGGAAFMLALLTLGGVAVLWPRKKSTAPTTAAVDVEQLVLEAARANRGRITAIEVATDGRLSHADAESVLGKLERAGACRSLIGESGIVVYYFPEFESAAAKSDVFFGEEEEALRRRAARATEKN